MPGAIGRIDGRRNTEHRSIDVFQTDTSVLLRKYHLLRDKKIYSSTVILYYGTEIKKQKQEYSKNGYFSIFCSSKQIQAELEHLFKETTAVSLESLSIIPRKAAWGIRIDIFIVNDQGGVLEMCVLGVQRALKNVLFPVTPLILNDGSEFVTRPVSFSPKHSITTETSGVLNKEILFDLLPEEEEKAEALLMLSLNSENEISHLVFFGAAEKNTYLQQLEKTIDYIKSN